LCAGAFVSAPRGGNETVSEGSVADRGTPILSGGLERAAPRKRFTRHSLGRPGPQGPRQPHPSVSTILIYFLAPGQYMVQGNCLSGGLSTRQPDPRRVSAVPEGTGGKNGTEQGTRHSRSSRKGTDTDAKGNRMEPLPVKPPDFVSGTSGGPAPVIKHERSRKLPGRL